MPFKDLCNTTEISEMAQEEQEQMNLIDQAVFESEQEIVNGEEALDAETVFAELEKKYFE